MMGATVKECNSHPLLPLVRRLHHPGHDAKLPISLVSTSTRNGSMARKIEHQMTAAILNCVNWKSRNTKVENRQTEFGIVSDVFLYGNLIATVGDDSLTLYDGGHRSKTTKSRLNAILRENGNQGDAIIQRNFEWFICYDGKIEPFENGATLG